MTDTIHEVLTLGRHWAAAEERADVAALDALSTANFTLVGPLGFVLDKAQWLDRYRSGALRTESLSWDDVGVRDHGQLALAIGVQTQRAAFHGRAAHGSFRVTQVCVREAAGWKLAALHLSPLPETAASLVAALRSAP